MIRRAASLLLAALLCAPAAPAQGPGGRTQERAPGQPQPGQDDVIRVRTTLVELSAVVTDARGRAVEDLSREDFEVFENDRPRQVSFFSVEPAAGKALRRDTP